MRCGMSVKMGIMSGTSDATFSPDLTASRAMIVTMLYRLAGSPDIEDENWGYAYADVDAESWYGTAVYWARLNGIVSGYSEERVRTGRPGQPRTVCGDAVPFRTEAGT